VAYRQLLTVAGFVCGLVAAGCGSGSNGSAANTDITSDDAPADSDEAASGSDQTPSGKDQPPPSSDQAPSASPGGKSGGGAVAACQAFCDRVGGSAGCPGDNLINAAVRAICDSGCKLDEAETACQSEAVAALNCLAGLAGLCTADGPSADDAASCQQSQEAVDTCEAAHKPPAMQTEPCSMAGGCQCDNDTCKSCKCVLGEQSPTCQALCN